MTAGVGHRAQAETIRRWGLILMATLPWLLPLANHLWNAGAEATGFISYDAPYYVANGREVFERGNGWAYPNPYDPDPAAPVIYFHWLPWLLGFGVSVLGCDPGLLFALIGVLGAVGVAVVTWRLVETMLPESRGRGVLFLLTLWGGGALCLAGWVATWGGGSASLTDLFRFDRPMGWWFPNWGRNLILSTEAVYHVLAALAWLGALRRRWGLAIGAVAVVAATHPFTGLHQLLILGAWCGILALRERNRAAWGRCALVAAVAAVFAGYYFVFLESFPAHRLLQAGWSRGWRLPGSTILLAAGPAAAVAVWRLNRQKWRIDERDGFLLTATVVTLVLMNHDLIVAPHQPAHFSRGYNWLPVWLLALPQLQIWGLALWDARPRWPARAGLVLAVVFIVADNAVFLVRELRDGELDRQHLTRPQREMLAWMEREKLDGVLLCADSRLSYLTATYTRVRPYFGHLANTPEVGVRWREVKAWHQKGDVGPWFATIDYVLIERTNPPGAFAWGEWRELHRNADYILLGRAPLRR